MAQTFSVEATTGDFESELEEIAGPWAKTPLPGFEGLVVDRYEIAFGGKVELNRFLGSDNELIRAARLGETVRLTVEALVVARPHGFKPAKEDDDSAGEVTSGHRLKVLTAWLSE